jgi:hypothetical protein
MKRWLTYVASLCLSSPNEVSAQSYSWIQARTPLYGVDFVNELYTHPRFFDLFDSFG